MKCLISHTDRFNELVFENRHKAYGAYAIRKTYSDTVMKACIITFSGLALLLGSAMVANNLGKKPEAEVPKTAFVETDTIDMDLNNEEKEKLKTEEPQQRAAAPPPADLPTGVTDAQTTPTLNVTEENPVSGQGDPNAQGTSSTSTLTTANTSTVESTGPSTITVRSTPEEVVIASDMPEFEGGIDGLKRFLAANIVYPEQAKTIGIEGTVYISFVVDENGNVGGAKILKGIGYDCDEEALRVVNKIPKWKKPGRNANQPVRVRFNLPISFRLR